MERVMTELSNYFAGTEKVDLHLVLYGKNPSVFYTLPQNITIHKPEYEFNDRYRFWFTLKTLLFIRGTIKKIRPFTILSFGEYWNSLVLLALLGAGFNVFISDRSQPGMNLGRFHNFLRKCLYPRAKGYIAQTDKAAQIAKNNRWNSNIIVIGNPVTKPPTIERFKKEKIVLSVGRLIHTKHFDRLIEVFARINLPGWKIVIVGGDAKKQKNYSRLKELIEELKVQDRVFLKGVQNNISDYYSKSQIFAFFSSSEGFPNVIGEALSFGLPVIAFDCVAGPSELINNGENGYLVKLHDYQEAQAKLMLLMKDEHLRKKMARKAPKSVEPFLIENVGEKYLTFITEMTG